MAYNGWSNYETWNVKLWMDNDGSDQYWNEQAEEIAKQYGKDNSASYLADMLKEEMNENAPDLGASCFSDLLSAALSEVDWYEIAEAILENVEIEEEAE